MAKINLQLYLILFTWIYLINWIEIFQKQLPWKLNRGEDQFWRYLNKYLGFFFQIYNSFWRVGESRSRFSRRTLGRWSERGTPRLNLFFFNSEKPYECFKHLEHRGFLVPLVKTMNFCFHFSDNKYIRVQLYFSL